MSKLTRDNIAYDLNISPHHTEVKYRDYVLKYVFSSELYRKKFLANIESHREKINSSLSNRFGFAIRENELADLKLYVSIEKRGFLIYKGTEKIICLEDIILDGQNLTKKN